MTYTLLRIACYYGYFAVGLILTVPGPVIPALQEAFALSTGQVGAMFLAQGAGFALAVAGGGALSDTSGRRPVLIAGAVLVTLTLFAFARVNTWGAALLLFGVAAAGFGLVEACLNSLTIDLARGNEGRALNLLHLFPALGAVAGPYLGSSLAGRTWAAPFLAIGGLFLIFTLGVAFLRFPPAEASAPDGPAGSARPSTERGGQERRGRAAMREERGEAAPPWLTDPLVHALAVVMALYVGVEIAVSSWTVSYALQELRASPVFGAALTSLFWLALALGRLVCGAVSDRAGHMRTLILTSAGALAGFSPVFLRPAPAALAASLFVTGFFLGGVFPTALAHAGTLVRGPVGAATGAIIAVGTLGGAVIPAVVGLVANRGGMQAGMRTAALALGLLLLALLVTRSIELRRFAPAHHESGEREPPVQDVPAVHGRRWTIRR